MLYPLLAERSPDFTPSPDLYAIEATGALEDLLDPMNMMVAHAHQDRRDSRPPAVETLIEMNGPALARELQLQPNKRLADYPKVSVKVAHLEQPVLLEDAFEGFQHYTRKAAGKPVRLNLPDVRKDEAADSIAIFTMVLSLGPGKMETSFAQVHYDKDGIALPYDIGLCMPKRASKAEFSNYWMNSIKNLGLMIFAWQNNVPFASESRTVPIKTKTGTIDVNFEFLQND